MMDKNDRIIELLHSAPAETSNENEWLQQLASMLNDLILHDFNALVQLLYRVDVPEQKVKQLLKEQAGADAGTLLAHLLWQRQMEKTKTLRRSRSEDRSIADDEEAW